MSGIADLYLEDDKSRQDLVNYWFYCDDDYMSVESPGRWKLREDPPSSPVQYVPNKRRKVFRDASEIAREDGVYQEWVDTGE